MKWYVAAADAQTGEDRAFLIEAATAADAEAAVRGAGYLVSQVTAASQPDGSPPADDRADPLAALAAVATAPPTAAALLYRPPPNPRLLDRVMAAPDYWGLRFGSVAFLAFACLFYLAGLLLILLGLGRLLTRLGDTPGFAVLEAFVQFLLSLWPLATGATFHALSSACIALRDIARNSFNDQPAPFDTRRRAP